MRFGNNSDKVLRPIELHTIAASSHGLKTAALHSDAASKHLKLSKLTDNDANCGCESCQAGEECDCDDNKPKKAKPVAMNAAWKSLTRKPTGAGWNKLKVG